MLLVAGNPQRTLRTNVVQQGSVKVLEVLRGKLVDGDVSAVRSECVFQSGREATAQLGRLQLAERPAPMHQEQRTVPGTRAGGTSLSQHMQQQRQAAEWNDDSQLRQHEAATRRVVPSQASRSASQQRSQALKSTNMKRATATNPSDYF